MRELRNVFLAVLILLFSNPQIVAAHEGDHDAPGTVQAPKGGRLKSFETIHIELLSEGRTVRLYVYDLGMRPANVTKYPVKASISLPKKKSEPIALIEKGDHWTFDYDSKGAHRYTLELDVRQGGHQDRVKWTIEPKSP